MTAVRSNADVIANAIAGYEYDARRLGANIAEGVYRSSGLNVVNNWILQAVRRYTVTSNARNGANRVKMASYHTNCQAKSYTVRKMGLHQTNC